MGRVLTSRRRAAGESGVGVVTVLAISAAVFAAGAAILQVAAHQVQGSALDRRRQQAFDAAEAGLTAARARMASDDSVDWTITGTLPDGSAAYTVTVSLVNGSTDPDRRLLAAVGSAPATNPIVQRRVEQEVSLDAIDRFQFALFGGTGGLLASDEPVMVDGSLYAGLDLALPADATVKGDVLGAGAVDLAAGSFVSGSVVSGGDVVVSDGTTVVQGSVAAVGAVTVDGTVAGDVLAGGSVGGNGAIGGSAAPEANPPAPSAWSMPAYDDGAYAPTDTLTTGGSDLDIPCSSVSDGARLLVVGGGTATLRGPCTLDAGVEAVIVAEGSVLVDGRFDTASADPASLTVVSTEADVEVAGATDIDRSITTALVAPTGTVSFPAGSSRTSFSGVAYGETIDMAAEVWVTWAAIPDAAADLFSWTGSAPARFVIVPQEFREVATA